MASKLCDRRDLHISCTLKEGPRAWPDRETTAAQHGAHGRQMHFTDPADAIVSRVQSYDLAAD